MSDEDAIVEPGLAVSSEASMKMMPYYAKSRIQTAKYKQPITPLERKDSPGKTLSTTGGTMLLATLDSSSSSEGGRTFKTEKWREKGVQRWPYHAATELLKQPHQLEFAKAEEVIPVIRRTDNMQKNIGGEFWCRSLRTKALHIDSIGMHNGHVCDSTVAVMFDNEGHGWSGRTNNKNGWRRRHRGDFGPHTKEWVEAPVATGKYHQNHMGGSRYKMDMTPRNCVPNSMSDNKMSPRAPPTPRAMTAR
jgi:hypothetical protein